MNNRKFQQAQYRKDYFNERAAIYQFDGLWTKEEAEKKAYADLINEIKLERKKRIEDGENKGNSKS